MTEGATAAADGLPLGVLLVEDSEDDALLVLRELRRGGYATDHERVDTEAGMRRALGAREWDVVISDYSMPTFSAPAALRVMRECNVDLPFIITSGTIGEEIAVEALRAGAHDFMLKSRLARLVPAVEREMKDAEDRRAYRAAAKEVKRLEEQVRHAQKMEAIGRLAGGVAHDFNNILTAILTTSDMALRDSVLSEELRGDLETIRDSAIHAASITRQLLTFSRKQVVQPCSVDLNELVVHTRPLLDRLLRRDVAIEMTLRARNAVHADPTQLEQVLVNLVVNAGDAMPRGGMLTITVDDERVTQGPYVVLRVRDTGSGMDATTLTRVFEPFFTTKGAAHGTGLGLATVYGIVQHAGGHVEVSSRPGEGSLFEVYLPATEMLAAPKPAIRDERFDARGDECIIVVEDEVSVRAPICRGLRQLGYRVLEAKHGEDALIVLQQHHERVHAVITDMVMPEMSGAELVRRLHARYPQLRVLFMSGYSEELIAAQGALSHGAEYLAKPFTTAKLAERLRRLLDSSGLELGVHQD